MALITKNNYQAPRWLLNGHFDTIYPAFFRKVSIPVSPRQETIYTKDNDFFDLDYYDNNADKTVIISHGLEGNSQRPYVMGMAKIFYNSGWNVIAWNYRGCNGKINKSIKSYHSGFTEDLEEVINHADLQKVKTISMIGFSLGGNLTLKYLGDNHHVHPKIKSVVALSVPLDLYHGCLQISKPSNFIYSKRFLRTLKQKVRDKAKHFTEIKVKYLPKIHDLMTFDDYYTAPLHGFKDALDYYTSCSAINVLGRIKIPTLIINALNDPFLPKECYPFELIKDHPYVHLETPERGGHVGFYSQNGMGSYWSEKRSLDFIRDSI